MMKNALILMVAVILGMSVLADPQITSYEVKKNGDVKITMTSDVPFELVATSDFVNYVVLETNKPKPHVVYTDKRRQKEDPYFFYFVRPISK